MPPILRALALSVLIASPVAGTPTKEAPWLPEAGAYRLSLFLGNLAPVPWNEVQRAWDRPYRGSVFATGALERLSTASGIDTQALEQAIAGQDR